MTKLKTLKDMSCSHNSEYSCCEDREKMIDKGKEVEDLPHGVDVEDLRKEAIKWIKELKDTRKGIFDLVGEKARIVEINGQILWIKHFFNITEEVIK